MKTLKFNRGNWTGEIGSVTYDPEKPLHFQVDSLPEVEFWLELTPWKGLEHLSPEDREDILETIGDRYEIHSNEGHVLGEVVQDKKFTQGQSGDVSRDDYDDNQTFTRAESLLVTAARLIFNTV